MDSINGPLLVKDVDVDEEMKKKILDHFDEKIEEALQDRQHSEEKWSEWIDQYNGRSQRTGGNPRDSQIDTTASRERAQHVRARVLNPIFQQDQICVAIPRRPGLEDVARTYERAIDFITDKVDMLNLCDAWFKTAEILPYGVVKVGWTVKNCKVLEWEYAEVETENGFEKQRTGETTEQVVTTWVGSEPELVPPVDFIFPHGASDVDSAEWVADRSWPTRHDLKAQIRELGWEVDIEELGDPGGDRDQYDISDSDEEDNSDRFYEVVEVYGVYDVDDDGYDEEVVLTYERQSKTLLRLVHNFWHEYRRPFVPFCYEDIHGSIPGVPLMYIVESEHRLYSAQRQQRLDNASRANETCVFYDQASNLDKVFEKNTLKGGAWPISGSDDISKRVAQFQLAYPMPAAAELANLGAGALQHMDDAIGIGEYLRGNETIQRPTATGQTALIEEAKQALYLLVERFRRRLADVVKMMLARYKQFYPDGLEIYKMVATPEEAQQLESEILQWPDGAIEDSVFIETKVSSATMNKQLKKQESLALVDKLPQVFGFMMQLTEAATTPSPVSPMAADILTKYWQAVKTWYSDFDLNEAKLLPDVTSAIQIGQMFQQVMEQNNKLMQQNQQLMQQSAMLGAALQGGAPPGPGGMGGPAPSPMPPGGGVPPPMGSPAAG